MKAILATNHSEVNKYIIKTHQDILIVAQADSADRCLEALSIHRPDLIITSDVLMENKTWDEFKTFLFSVKEGLSKGVMLCLFTQIQLAKKQMDELNAKGIHYLSTPISEQSLSRSLYNLAEKEIWETEPRVVAIWSPKPGDGSSLVTEAASYVLCDHRVHEECLIGVLDFHLQRPFLKYRYQLDESMTIDDLMPYISSGTLSPEILKIIANSVVKKRGLKFIGGIARPELFGRYGYIHFNSLIDTARRTFYKTVIDAGGDLCNPGTVTALKNADLILTVMQPNYVSKICLKHSIELFPTLGINPNKVKLVLNKFRNQGSEDPKVIMSGINIELLGTLADLGPDADKPGEPSVFSGSGSRAAVMFKAKLKDIIGPAPSMAAKEEGRKGTLCKIFTRSVG